MAVAIYEDNAGQVYIGHDDEIWILGTITPNLYNSAVQDAEAWESGDWQPNTTDRQELVEDAEITLIGTWTAQDGLQLERDEDGEILAGAGGSDYMGLNSSGEPLGPMTAAKFKVTREFLGLTTKWLAGALGVQERTVQRWDSGATPVPGWVQYRLQKMSEQTDAVVEAAVEQAERNGGPYITYRTDSEYRSADPSVEWPASWHRAVGARVVHRVSGLTIVFQERPES